MLDDSFDDQWVFRRNHRIRRALDTAIRYDSERTPYLAPEIQLRPGSTGSAPSLVTRAQNTRLIQGLTTMGSVTPKTTLGFAKNNR